ncbi:hypothetical protein AJ88_05615 [Mesorhizobium amorphae CCBAU 01583]|nr:hypothetical protein AJ88_05615 [Mesorhizobium amorphae CCBAU 01583]
MQAQPREFATDFGDQGREGRLFAEAIAAQVVRRRGDLLMRADMGAEAQQRGVDGFDVVDGAGTDEDFR